jgi:hypothetical protein
MPISTALPTVGRSGSGSADIIGGGAGGVLAVGTCGGAGGGPTFVGASSDGSLT